MEQTVRRVLQRNVKTNNMVEGFEEKMDLIKAVSEKNAVLVKHILTEEQVEAVSTLISMAILEYDAYRRVIENKANIEWRDNFLKMQEQLK